MDKIKVVNMMKYPISVSVPQIPFSYTWTMEGASRNIDADVLEELLYDPGFRYMIDTGMLYFNNLDFKKTVGLESEESEVEETIIPLNSKECRRFLVNLSQAEFKEKLAKLSKEQVNMLTEYAIANRLIDREKLALLQKITGRDVLHAILLKDAKEN